MSSRPDRRRSLLAGLLAVGLLCGCGKADLQRTTATITHPAHAGHQGPPARKTRPAPPAERVTVPLPLTAAVADRFARAVTLVRADVPGAKPGPRSHTPAGQEREAAKCGARELRTLGSGRSEEFTRGTGLNRESISSAVAVLGDAGQVRSDLAYAVSRAGLDCSAKVVANSLEGEKYSRVRLLRVRVGHIALAVGPRGRARGLRITARVAIPRARIEVPIYVDALSLPYGPAELNLYTTSFVQPSAERTQSELLALLRARARLQKL